MEYLVLVQMVELEHYLVAELAIAVAVVDSVVPKVDWAVMVY